MQTELWAVLGGAQVEKSPKSKSRRGPRCFPFWVPDRLDDSSTRSNLGASSKPSTVVKLGVTYRVVFQPPRQDRRGHAKQYGQSMPVARNKGKPVAEIGGDSGRINHEA